MRRGGKLETDLRVVHDGYRRDRLAWVVPTHPEAKFLGGDLTFVAKGPPDFIGCVDGGLLVVFDAKETAKSSFYFSNLIRKGSDHQARDLTAAYDRGAYSFILVSWTKKRKYTILPWGEIQDDFWSWRFKRTKKASISIKDPRNIELPGAWWYDVIESVPRSAVADRLPDPPA